VRVVLRDGRVLRRAANGARGYPERPASGKELAAKFLVCAARALPAPDANRLLTRLQDLEVVDDVRTITNFMRA
jgi:hypothetical protein